MVGQRPSRQWPRGSQSLGPATRCGSRRPACAASPSALPAGQIRCTCRTVCSSVGPTARGVRARPTGRRGGSRCGVSFDLDSAHGSPGPGASVEDVLDPGRRRQTASPRNKPEPRAVLRVVLEAARSATAAGSPGSAVRRPTPARRRTADSEVRARGDRGRCPRASASVRIAAISRAHRAQPLLLREDCRQHPAGQPLDEIDPQQTADARRAAVRRRAVRRGPGRGEPRAEAAVPRRMRPPTGTYPGRLLPAWLHGANVTAGWSVAGVGSTRGTTTIWSRSVSASSVTSSTAYRLPAGTVTRALVAPSHGKGCGVRRTRERTDRARGRRPRVTRHRARRPGRAGRQWWTRRSWPLTAPSAGPGRRPERRSGRRRALRFSSAPSTCGAVTAVRRTADRVDQRWEADQPEVGRHR